MVVGGTTRAGGGEGSNFAKKDGVGLEAPSVEGRDWVVIPRVQGEEADTDGTPAPVPLSYVADDEVGVGADSGIGGGFAKETGETETEEIVVGAVGGLGKSVDGVGAGADVEGGMKPVVVAAAAPSLMESPVLGVAKMDVEVFAFLCGML